MGSRYPHGFYDDQRLAVLETAFRDVWKTLAMKSPLRNPEPDEGLRTAIVQRLLGLVEAGITQPEELRARALVEFGSKVTSES
jgi:hypothetical protein